MGSNMLRCLSLRRTTPLQNASRSSNWRGICRAAIAGAGIVCLLSLAPPASGQDDSDDPPAAADTENDGADEAWEKLIYLPYRNLKDVFDRHGSTVFMPYAEYLKRWQSPSSDDEPLIEAVITESHYTASVDQSLLRINAELTVRVLGKPWVEVPVQFGNAAVGKLTVPEGSNILLKGTGNGTYSLLFGEAGEHKVQLELATAIQTSPDGRSAEFRIPVVGITTFELTIPEADQTVEISPQLISLPVEAADGETRIKANLGSTDRIAASWNPRTSLKPDMDLLAAVTNYQKVSLRDGLQHTDAWLEYDVLRGELTELAIAVPVGQRILGVSSPNAKIRGWKKEPADQQQTVRVEFLNPVRDKVTIEVHTETEFGADALELAGRDDQGQYHGIHAIDAVRESGQIAVATAEDLSLQIDQLRGLVRIEDAEIAASIKQAGAATFKFYSANIGLRVVASPIEPRLLVTSQYPYVLEDDELKLNANYQYMIERAGVFELQVGLPEGLEVDNVNTSVPLREYLVEGEDADRVLRIVFQQKTAKDTAVSVAITSHVKLEEASDTRELTLPIPEPLGVERETAGVFLSARDSLEVISNREDIVAAQPAPLGQINVQQGYRAAAAWTFNRRPVVIPVNTERRPTRLTAQVGTAVNVGEENIGVTANLTYQVQFAGLDTFRFSVPEDISDSVKVVSLEGTGAPGIRQRVPAGEAIDGWITWTITMQRDVTGSHRFQVTWDQKPESDADAEDEDEPEVSTGPVTNKAVVQTLRVLGLDGSGENEPEVPLSDVTGEVVVQKDRSLSVSATALDESLEAIDVRELSLLPQSGALAFRYYGDVAVGVNVSATKHEIQKVLETVITRGLVEIVARHDAQVSYRCRYRIRSSERQRLQLDVPVGSELLGVFLGGQQVSPEKNTAPVVEGWDSYFINVARPGSSDDMFTLTVQMHTPTDAKRDPFTGWGRGLSFGLPQVGGLDNPGVAVQQLQTVIWVPEDYALIGDADGFIHETKLRLDQALIEEAYRWGDYFEVDDWVSVPVTGYIDFPTAGNRFRYSNLGGATQIEVRWASRPNYTWLFSGALILIAVLLRGLSWDAKVLLVLLGVVASLLFSLSNPGWTSEIVSASRYGLFGMAAIWILHTIFTWRISGERLAPRTAVGASGTTVIPPPGVFDDIQRQFNQQ